MALDNTLGSVTKIVRGLIKDQTQKDGSELFEYIGDPVFTLSEPYIDLSSISVYQNNTVLSSSDFSFNSSTNQVTVSFVTSGLSFTNGDLFRISYEYYKKFSDEEIRSYIESSLAYFSQYRYKKIFEIEYGTVSENSKIVAVDDTIPNTKELYFISLISSILIDPQNIKMETSDFKLSANRSMSDQQQIKSAFADFKRFVGKVYLEYTDGEYNVKK